ncbi:MAG: glutathione S-transferase [Acidocella sp. 20-57-95]|nr:MAG: glutathione S-transferase [Acidocella sp. 20-57-95]OYV62212.1 MAG: glutathione S-transferase [Acidocella sp. 21-58-7]HQT63750.1 glutathione S-transferase [Acidocella sp.]HQU03126.1 glutathione S-transferase [Acidocella sp.]
MVIVHHLNNSRSQRVIWLLEELGVPYEVKRYERDAKTMLAPASLRAVHPLGKSPVITDGDLTIAETGTIVEYLIATYGQGRMIPAAGTPERLRYNYWIHYAEGSAMPPLVMKLIFGAIPKSPQLPWFIKPVAKALMKGVTESYLDPQIKAHVALWDGELQKSAFFAGNELTGADIMMSFPVEAASSRGTLTPKLTAYLAAIHGRDAYKKALAAGGPYELLGS